MICIPHMFVHFVLWVASWLIFPGGRSRNAYSPNGCPSSRPYSDQESGQESEECFQESDRVVEADYESSKIKNGVVIVVSRVCWDLVDRVLFLEATGINCHSIRDRENECRSFDRDLDKHEFSGLQTERTVSSSPDLVAS